MTDKSRPALWSRVYLCVELVVLFFGVPGVFAAMIDPEQRFRPALESVGLGALFDLGFPPTQLLFPLLLTATGLILIVLVFDRSFEKRRLWNVAGMRRELRRMLVVYAVCAPLLVGLAWVLSHRTGMLPEGSFFRLPRERTNLWIAIMCLYPVFSAYPQEITHRAFFFHRYRSIIPEAAMVPASAIAFCFLHVPFWNWVALAMTLVGGVLFSWTYARSRSTLAAGFEHALYGNTVFTVGLGWFVFAGSVGR